ncbi:MAG: polysaccharide deacetylase family protein [Candidatus Hodarchaeota archaeon]
MKKGNLIIYWDYELQKGGDTSNVGYNDGIEDYNQTEFILKYLKKHDIRTCFAILGHTAQKGELPYHAPEQIRQMAEEDHEVGSHTQNHKRISQISYSHLIYELQESKKNIEKITRTKCVSFVPPWDKPQYFFGQAIDFKPRTTIPKKSKLNHQQICLALRKTRYKTYRICPLTSRINPYKLSKPFKYTGIVNIPCRLSNGFGINAKKLVKKVVEKKGLAVIYAHPRGLVNPGAQNKVNFIDFIEYLFKLKENKKIQIILPNEIARNTFSL